MQVKNNPTELLSLNWQCQGSVSGGLALVVPSGGE